MQSAENILCVQGFQIYASRLVEFLCESFEARLVQRFDATDSLLFMQFEGESSNLAQRLFHHSILARYIHRYYWLHKRVELAELVLPRQREFCKFYSKSGTCPKRECKFMHVPREEQVQLGQELEREREQAHSAALEAQLTPALHAITSHMSLIDGAIFRIVAAPRTHERWFGEHLPLSIELHPKNFTHVLFIVQHDNELRWGVTKPELLYERLDEDYVVTNAISRAYYKLAEAAERIPIPLQREWRAIDIGSSPGGWTQFLAEKVSLVVSIDPAPLRIEIPANVVSLCKRAEDSVLDLQQHGPFDIIVCDMNGPIQGTMQRIAPALEFLRAGGYLVLTVKLIK
jgi:hypothetical protein